MTRLLIVEDHADIAIGLKDHLAQEGFDARIAALGGVVPTILAEWPADVLVLDLMLPDMSGYEVLQRLRTDGHELPVLILSARSDEMAKVRGFRVGADDYVTKPVGLHELTERLRVLARRAAALRPAAPGAPMRFGDIEISPAARRVTRGGVEVALRPKEFDLLLALAAHPDQVVTRGFLLEHAWAYEPGVASRTVDWHVAELRRKLGDDPDAPRLIETVRKAGYRWAGRLGATT